MRTNLTKSATCFKVKPTLKPLPELQKLSQTPPRKTFTPEKAALAPVGETDGETETAEEADQNQIAAVVSSLEDQAKPTAQADHRQDES